MDPQDPSNPGDTPASPTGDSGNPQNPQAPTNGSDSDNNTGNPQEPAMVPSDRLREETSKRKQAEERAAEAERQLATRNQPDTTPEDEDEIDPNVEKLVSSIIKKQGYVKKDEVQSAVQASERARQYKEDIGTLTSKYAKTGVPFVESDVRSYAKDNGINITSKASLEAAYRDMNFDKITEAAKNAAINDFKENGQNGGERPGHSSNKPNDKQTEVRGLKNRVHAAASKLRT